MNQPPPRFDSDNTLLETAAAPSSPLSSGARFESDERVAILG